MADLESLKRELVRANKILAHEGVVDTFGHVSVRHPERPDRYFLSQSRAPEVVTFDDILEFTLDGDVIDGQGRPLYQERPIHGAMYKARPNVNSVVHNHAYEVIPFGITGTTIKPLLHVAASIGDEVPIWDIRDKFGDTNLLVVTMEQGEDLAKSVGDNSTALMRGHGCVVTGPDLRRAVLTSIYLMVNARLQHAAHSLGEITFLSPGEARLQRKVMEGDLGVNRAWEYLVKRADCAEV